MVAHQGAAFTEVNNGGSVSGRAVIQGWASSMRTQALVSTQFQGTVLLRPPAPAETQGGRTGRGSADRYRNPDRVVEYRDEPRQKKIPLIQMKNKQSEKSAYITALGHDLHADLGFIVIIFVDRAGDGHEINKTSPLQIGGRSLRGADCICLGVHLCCG